jgi:hypothetical protein
VEEIRDTRSKQPPEQPKVPPGKGDEEAGDYGTPAYSVLDEHGLGFAAGAPSPAPDDKSDG